MSDLSELYQQVILDHYKQPRNFKKLTDANRSAEGFNPLCGDRIHVYVQLAGDTINDISFEGTGCAISKASASLMTESIKGKNVKEAETLFQKIHHMLTASTEEQVETSDLGKLAAFSGVREFPVRVKCATLAWHTFKAALAGRSEVSTEAEERIEDRG